MVQIVFVIFWLSVWKICFITLPKRPTSDLKAILANCNLLYSFDFCFFCFYLLLFLVSLRFRLLTVIFSDLLIFYVQIFNDSHPLYLVSSPCISACCKKITQFLKSCSADNCWVNGIILLLCWQSNKTHQGKCFKKLS